MYTQRLVCTTVGPGGLGLFPPFLHTVSDNKLEALLSCQWWQFILHNLQAILTLCYSVQYILLGAEEGLFSLLVTNNPDPVMEQVRPVYAYTLYASLLPSAVRLYNCVLNLSLPPYIYYSRGQNKFYVLFSYYGRSTVRTVLKKRCEIFTTEA